MTDWDSNAWEHAHGPEFVEACAAHRRRDAGFDRRADDVFAALEDVPATALQLLATALRASDGPLNHFWDSFLYFGDAVELGRDEDPWMARIRLGFEFGSFMHRPDEARELIVRLDGIEAAPWPQIRAGVEAALAERAAAGWDHESETRDG